MKVAGRYEDALAAMQMDEPPSFSAGGAPASSLFLSPYEAQLETATLSQGRFQREKLSIFTAIGRGKRAPRPTGACSPTRWGSRGRVALVVSNRAATGLQFSPRRGVSPTMTTARSCRGSASTSHRGWLVALGLLLGCTRSDPNEDRAPPEMPAQGPVQTEVATAPTSVVDGGLRLGDVEQEGSKRRRFTLKLTLADPERPASVGSHFMRATCLDGGVLRGHIGGSERTIFRRLVSTASMRVEVSIPTVVRNPNAYCDLLWIVEEAEPDAPYRSRLRGHRMAQFCWRDGSATVGPCQWHEQVTKAFSDPIVFHEHVGWEQPLRSSRESFELPISFTMHAQTFLAARWRLKVSCESRGRRFATWRGLSGPTSLGTSSLLDTLRELGLFDFGPGVHVGVEAAPHVPRGFEEPESCTVTLFRQSTSDSSLTCVRNYEWTVSQTLQRPCPSPTEAIELGGAPFRLGAFVAAYHPYRRDLWVDVQLTPREDVPAGTELTTRVRCDGRWSTRSKQFTADRWWFAEELRQSTGVYFVGGDERLERRPKRCSLLLEATRPGHGSTKLLQRNFTPTIRPIL